MKEAILYNTLPGDKVRCNLCAHRCVIHNGKKGVCGVRQNIDGILYSLNHGKLIAQHVDPIEKKPLFHFYPGSTAYSIATVGCNFRCAFCQNYDISLMPIREDRIMGEYVPPEEVVAQAVEHSCQSIAYTYTEPTIFFDYALDVARIAYKKNIKNIFVTNGYLTPEALQTIAPYLDAANVDLKSFSENFYKRICKAKLQPVLDTLTLMKKLGIWLEVTTLVIPTMNDTEQELQSIAEFVVNLGDETPWHINAFYPAYKLKNLPPTPRRDLYRAQKVGQKAGLRYVYIGNINDTRTETTYCHHCKKALIRRSGFQIIKNFITNGRCPFCGTAVDGIGLSSIPETRGAVH